MTTRQVGTVEILADRIYPLDPYDTSPSRTEVMVTPGQYPVYRGGDGVFWVMIGRLNTFKPIVVQVTDSISVISGDDQPKGPPVTFPSRTFTDTEFQDLLTQPGCTEGDPEQRLRFTLTDFQMNTTVAAGCEKDET